MIAEPFVVRPASHADLPDLLALYAQLNPGDPAIDPQRSHALMTKMSEHPGMTIFVGIFEDKVVATVTLIVIPNMTRNGAPYALIENVVTDTDYRKSGYGRATLQRAIADAWQAGCYKVMLLTGRSDSAILRFYERSGFVQDKTGFQIRRPT